MFEGKVALITGGGTGIGLGIARVLASRGVKIAIVQNRACEDLPEGALFLEADIADPEAVARVTDRVVSHFGRLDIAVNNAALTGKPAVAPFLECTPGQLDRIVDVNLKGTYYVSQYAARQMVKQGGGGAIVHIASVGAFAAQEHASAYCATKAAVAALAQAMAIELAPHGIRVNAVAPGDIYTNANAAIVDDLKQGGATGRFLRTTPLGRRGTPEEIGHAVAFLASDEASFITGTTLLVDGGFLAY